MEALLATLNKIFGKWLAPDKILHLVASFGVMLFIIALVVVMTIFGIHPLAQTFVVGGVCAAFSVEGTQWFDNRNAAKRGDPPPHEVSMADAVASFFWPVVVAVIIQALFVTGYLQPMLDAVYAWAKAQSAAPAVAAPAAG